MKEDKNRVCPVELSRSLDTKMRRWLQNPKKILAPYVKEGMRVLDFGCGPGFFTIWMAEVVGEKGKVIAADLQLGMLEKLRDKISGTSLSERIQAVKCDKDNINVNEKVDFILAFYVVHEVPEKENLFTSLKNILNDDGKVLVVEPKLFHVSKKEFALTISKAEKAGFNSSIGPRLAFCHSSILQIGDN
ncbi:MAG: class I SAM-dependent methyltransferase [Ignavibacteria bacterium]|jgi:ubiquinone/menaquinone biosynthesis C-methylase UbiE